MLPFRAYPQGGHVSTIEWTINALHTPYFNWEVLIEQSRQSFYPFVEHTLEYGLLVIAEALLEQVTQSGPNIP